MVTGDLGVLDTRVSSLADLGILVTNTDLNSGRGDLYVALNLARVLTKRNLKVSLIPPKMWYLDAHLPKKILIMYPTVEVGRIEGVASRNLIAWARNNFEKWVNLANGEAINNIFGSSVAGVNYLRRRYGSRVNPIPARIGYDPERFGWSSEEKKMTITISSNNWGASRQSHQSLDALASIADVHLFGAGTPPGVGRKNLVKHGMVEYESLPDVYRRSLMVIDDLQSSNLRFGPINSRFFDALASGAMPITNTKQELLELGLDHLPVWKNQEELCEIATEIAHNSMTRQSILKKNKQVATLLTTEKLAAPLIDHIESSNGSDVRSTIVFPDYRSTNEYQNLVYKEASQLENEKILFTSDFEKVFREFRLARGAGVDYDFHWLEPIIMPGTEQQTVNRILSIVSLLQTAKATDKANIRFFLHNLRPHEPRKLGLYRFLVRALLRLSGEVVAHNPNTLSLLGEDASSEVRYLKHPSYEGVYPDWSRSDWCKEDLGIPADKFVVGMVGALRPYKGVIELIEKFLETHSDSMHLLIAGRAEPASYKKALSKLTVGVSNVTFVQKHVSNDEISRFVRALDLAVIPFRSGLNSGSLILNESFGLKTLVPSSSLGGNSGDNAYEFDDLGLALSKIDKALRDLP